MIYFPVGEFSLGHKAEVFLTIKIPKEFRRKKRVLISVGFIDLNKRN